MGENAALDRRKFWYGIAVGVFVLAGVMVMLVGGRVSQTKTMLPVAAAGNTFYVSLSGSDSNNGSQSAPFKTFNYAKRVLQPGDTLRIFGGTYTEPLDLTISGTANAPITVLPIDGQQVTIDVQNRADRAVWLRGNYLKVAGLTVKNASLFCVALSGEYTVAEALSVSACETHSVFIGGKHNAVLRSVVHDSVLENQDRSGNWGSAIKVERGAEDITIDGNTVYRNFGEGIGVTMGKNVRVINNVVYDNFSVNIYIDNSLDVVVERNIAGCTGYEPTLRDGNRPAALSLAEELYSGWGSQLANITIRNNALVACSSGISDYGAESGSGGLDHVIIENNTVWANSTTPLDLSSNPGKTRNTVVARNIFHTAAARRPARVANLPGITLHDNYWVTTPPATGDKARGTNDVSGTPVFVVPPTFNEINSLQQTAGSPARDYGILFGGSVIVPSATRAPTPTTIPTLIVTTTPVPSATRTPTLAPLPSATRTPTPTHTPTSTPTPVPSVSPRPSVTAQPTTVLVPTNTPVPTSTTVPTNTSALLGDINRDGRVTLADLSLLLEVYGKSATVQPRADLNLDGNINALDYAKMIDLLNQ